MCSNGRADWVWSAYRSSHSELAIHSHLLQQPTCSRILAGLKNDSPRRLDFLGSYSGVSRTTLLRYLQTLLQAKLIREIEKQKYVLGAVFDLPTVEICAFEFKLSNWRRALYQAKRYRVFSHRVFVVAPPDTVSRMIGSINVFRRFGVGIISHSLDGRSQRIVPCPKQKPLSRHNFIQAVGMLLSQS